MSKTIFAWDLGATKCTAGVIEFNEASHELTCKKHFTLKLLDAHSLEDLIHKIQLANDFSMSEVDAVCIGAAGFYDGQELLLENAYPYSMPFAQLAMQYQWPTYAIIHDYASIVCATFTDYMDQPKNIKRLNDSPMQRYGRRVALGIGTGLGLKDGVLLSNGDFWLGENEIGHIGVPHPPYVDEPYLKRHTEIMRFLQSHKENRLQPVTFEKILSGSGTVRLFQFFYPDHETITPEEVGNKMCTGKIKEMMDAFAWYAGLFVGTVQLTFMPAGGVWITGGVALKNLDIFDRPDFLNGIYASPAYRPQRETYPLGILCNHEHALIGCGYYAAKRLLKSS